MNSDSVLECPSARSSMPGSRLFGIITGTPKNPLVGYLKEALPVTPTLLRLAGTAVEPEEVFRFAAPCAETECKHFDGTCRLVKRIVSNLSAEVRVAPPCKIRASCRW